MSTAAEQVVARLDSYSQEQHAERIKAAREHAKARRAKRAERAQAAAARMRLTITELPPEVPHA
jgi:hypothetical protein